MNRPLTEEYRCPLTGDDPGPRWPYQTVPREPPPGHVPIYVPGAILPPETTDAQAEHERAMMRAPEWSRRGDGRVYVWVEM